MGSIYTRQCRVVNTSDCSHKIRVLHPATGHFHVVFEKICPQGMFLAPGDSFDLTVTFSADSSVMMEDLLVIKCETCVLKVILRAINPFPWLDVPSTIDIGHCLVGYELPFVFPIVSKGAGAIFKISSDINDANDGAIRELNTFRVLIENHFIVYPKDFKLKKDERRHIFIIFMPQSAGQFTFVMKISTDCNHEWIIEIKGVGIDLDISVQDSENGKLFNFQELGEVAFGSGTISTTVHRKLLATNNMPIPLQFSWNVEDFASTTFSTDKYLNSKSHVFSVSPVSGILEPGLQQTITFSFTPHELQDYQKMASLFVASISFSEFHSPQFEELQQIIQSLRLKNDEVNDRMESNIGQQINEGVGNSSCIMSLDHVGKDSVKSSKLLVLKLAGAGHPLQIEFKPPVLQVLDMIEQGQSYTTSVLLKNKSSVDICFSWKLSELPDKAEMKISHVTVSPEHGTVNAKCEREFRVHFMAKAYGTLYETIFCQIIGGPELPLYIKGSIQGPSVHISPALLDFGVIKVKKSSLLELILKNRSNAAASFKLVSAPMPAIFHSYVEPMVDCVNNTGSLPEQLSCAVSSSCQGRNFTNPIELAEPVQEISNAYRACNQRDQCSELLFSPSEGTISKNGRLVVNVECRPKVSGHHRWAITCEVAGEKSLSQYAIARCQAAGAELYLSPSSLDLGVTYIGSSIQKVVYIHNLSILPCFFNWSEETFQSLTFVRVNVTPLKGHLSPSSKQEIIFSLSPTEPGEKNFSLTCISEGIIPPLTLNFRLYVSDIHCAIHIEQPLRINRFDYSMTDYSRFQISTLKVIDRSKQVVLDFGKKCSIGVVQSLKIVIQNETAIAGKIHASVMHYGLAPALGEELLAQLTGKHAARKANRKKLLGDSSKVANRQFSTDAGCIMSAQRQWASTCIKGGSQGIAIILSSTEGTLPGWGSWELVVFCYAWFPGDYKDILIIKAGDNVEYRIPVLIGVNGTPLLLRENKFDPQDFGRTGEVRCLTLNWNPVPAGHPHTSRIFWVANSAPYPLEVEWEFYEPFLATTENYIKVNLHVENDEEIVHVIMLGDPDKGPIQLNLETENITHVNLELIECEDNTVQRDSGFEIYPAKQFISPQSSVQFTVMHYSDDASTFVSNLRGNTYLRASKQQESIDSSCAGHAVSLPHCFDTGGFSDSVTTFIPPLYVSLQSVRYPPRLKTNMEAGLEFLLRASDEPHSSIKHVAEILNEYDYTLSFGVSTEPPFRLRIPGNSFHNETDNNLDTDANCGSISNITLLPKTGLCLEVNFMPSNEILRKREDQKFESNFMINISTKFQQAIPMTGILLFPKVGTYNECIWFGTVLKNSSQTLPFTVRNLSKVDAHWSLVRIKEDSTPSNTMTPASATTASSLENEQMQARTSDGLGDSAFTFDIQGGVLRASTESAISEQQVNATFSPNDSTFYRERVRIEVLHGCGCTFNLEGQGVDSILPDPAPPPAIPVKKQGKTKKIPAK
ncbi:hypothetical protein KP509_01G027000 [Ceratopteris richardii]|nr:hypothetical protein KP509_01G027000 [Ceratopteris richardii]KAH7445868.1 hypothetical protein KP509_01G027000 [Ceratopteris richardii]